MTMINSMCDRPTIQIETCPNKHVMHGPRCTKELSCTAAANIFVLIHTLVLVLCPQTFELTVPLSGTILKSTVRHNSAPTIRAKICNAKSEPRQFSFQAAMRQIKPIFMRNAFRMDLPSLTTNLELISEPIKKFTRIDYPLTEPIFVHV